MKVLKLITKCFALAPRVNEISVLVSAMVVDGLLALVAQPKPNTRASRVADIAATYFACYAILPLGSKITPPSV